MSRSYSKVMPASPHPHGNGIGQGLNLQKLKLKTEWNVKICIENLKCVKHPSHMCVET